YQVIFINIGYSIDNVKSSSITNTPKIIGWVDKNKDGINDKFRDSNGDGINDITNTKYDHHFSFVDKNKDGINDIFIDSDGDGVNDYGTKFVDENKDGMNDNVLDFDRDGINDITGLKYKKDDLMGYRYGIVEEEIKKTHKKFIDEDGDGMHDPIAKRMCFKDEDADGINDKFIDKDGDGICDGRRFGRKMGRQRQQSEQTEMGKGQKNRFRYGGGKGK
ncbi:MAG: hypothetical protein ACPL7B_17640, partial [Candidatus Poribacteria bacterium]